MPAIARPWHIGTLYHRDTHLPPLLLKLLRAEGDLVVGDNEPYAVSDETDYTIPVHGEARGLMNTGIEIRQDLIARPGRRAGVGGSAGADFWRDRNMLRTQQVDSDRSSRAPRRNTRRPRSTATASPDDPDETGTRGSSMASDGLCGLT